MDRQRDPSKESKLDSEDEERESIAKMINKHNKDEISEQIVQEIL